MVQVTKEYRDLVESLEEREAIQNEDIDASIEDNPIRPFSTALVQSATELAARDIPEREDIITDLLHTQALGMVFAHRGIGKTRAVADMADAIARGRRFLAWDVEKPRRVLFMDGELPAVDLQAIFGQVCGPKPSPLLDVISSEDFYATEHAPLTLNNIVHQQRLLGLLKELERADRRPEVIFFDNLSSMTYGTDENDNSDQDSILRFMLELRHLGYTVILVHHTGKGGDQRGASRREDFLDVSIKLADPPEPSTAGNAKFVLEFAKIRRKMPEPSTLECELVDDGTGRLVWMWNTLEQKIESWVETLRLVQTMKPRTQEEMVTVLNIGKGAVSKHLKKARDRKMLETEGLSLTDSGGAYLAQIYGTEGAF